MASLNVSILVRSSSPNASTEITFTPSAAEFVAPVAAHTTMGSFAIEPAGWVGELTLSGPDAASFMMTTSLSLMVSHQPLGPKTYNLTITAAP